MDVGMEQTRREAQLQARRREELDTLKQQRKERARTTVSANFSGKQKKQQLRARKQRLATRKDEEAALDLQSAQYEEFYAEKPPADDQFDEDDEVEAFRAEPDFFARNNDLDNDLSSRLKLTVALGKNNKDAVGKELSSFFVKETKEQIQLRLMEGQRPLDLTKRETPLRASVSERDPILDHPKRPRWTYSMSKEKVDTNESLMFDQWLTKIHDKYDNEHLNHFEHNLEVWRELWRVTERATHVVVVADVRNPLLHIPASVYDLVTKELEKPMIVVLNKVDLVPTPVVELWKRYLASRFPLAQLVCFSSRSNAVHGDNDVSTRRRVLSKKLEVGDASAVKGAVNILVACGVDAGEARQLAEELNSTVPEQETLQQQFEAVQDRKKATGGSIAAIAQANTPKVTIGLIGHPNVGKSSVLNALAGKKIVSVSHTPGHTKRLQSIMIAPEICICDCPGLVFPFAGVPKYLQELSGLYPYSQIREPYSAVRFLAEHVVLESILDLKPRTQHFDGLEEELEWTPWTLCEAYAEKRGYRTDRRGRPDHQRAGSELVRDTVDGILPLFFLPPDYKGKDITPASIAQYRQQEEAARKAVLEESDDDIDDNDDEVSDDEEEEIESSVVQQKNQKSAPNNAFSLLDSDSSDEDSDED
ncbi:Guanine nucleotide-binding-like protein 1 [Phytophthora boehmeriae]|uniref:Guanine nucleotide-binding-like protein 1 n=1 Tax=Phytophthora boehmeriae TaxID=109152 RepID=A0A8T1WGV3_9STRA|nr:Guanine nucleotide-binding-like protein 1 [Phytophthora boehmeriae]